jgi:hypothetical protein
MSASTTAPQPPPPSTDPGPTSPASPATAISPTGASLGRLPLVRVTRLVRGRPHHASEAPLVPTPLLLRLAMVAACLPVALFAVAVNLGVTRNDRAVETVGQDATRGITLAQQVKLDLAELDEIAVHDLVQPTTLGPSGFPDDYNAKRRDLDETLVLAAAEVPSGLAYQQRLVNIDYALGHYHAVLRDSFAAREQGNAEQAVTLYVQAHTVMQGTLLPQADSFDKANTYVLNSTYDRHKSNAASTRGFILGSWVLLLVVLIGLQVLLARRFRRVLNLALAAATLIAAASGIVVITRLDDSSADLTTAREGAFDAVHVLARARATVVAAWQAEGQLLLDPLGAATAPDAADDAAAVAVEGGFSVEVDKLFRVPAPVPRVTAARAGEVPEGSGGYLATVGAADVSPAGDEAATEALVAFAGFLEADEELRASVASGQMSTAQAIYEGREAYGQLVGAIDEAQAIDQRTFDDHAEAAEDATAGLGLLNLVVAGLVAALVLLGLYQRLREYR